MTTLRFGRLDRKLGRLHSKLDVIRASQLDLDDKIQELHEDQAGLLAEVQKLGRSVVDLHEKLDAKE